MGEGPRRVCSVSMSLEHPRYATEHSSLLSNANATASRMSYWFRRRERYHRPAIRPGEWDRRPSMCFVVDLHVTTAVLIHQLSGHLLVDDTLASWADVLRRRYWYIDYICWANTSWLTIHWHLPLGRTYMLRRRYISWADNTHILRRSRIAIHFLPGRTYHLGGATRTLPTWADVSFGNTLLAGRWYLSRRTYLPAWTDNSFGRLCNLYGEPSQAKRHEYCQSAMAIYRRCIRIEELCEDFEFNNKLK